jgi:hypothetical protein
MEPKISRSLVRIDISRNTTSKSTTFSNSKTIGTSTFGTPVTVTESSSVTSSLDRPYEMLALYIGNGIYIDRNNNIYFDPTEMFEGSQHQEIRDKKFTFTQSGNQFANIGRGIFAHRQYYEVQNNKIFSTDKNGKLGKIAFEETPAGISEYVHNSLGMLINKVSLYKEHEANAYVLEVTYGHQFQNNRIFRSENIILTVTSEGFLKNRLFKLVLEGNKIHITSSSDYNNSIIIERYTDRYIVRQGENYGTLIKNSDTSIDVSVVTRPTILQAIFGGNHSNYQIDMTP